MRGVRSKHRKNCHKGAMADSLSPLPAGRNCSPEVSSEPVSGLWGDRVSDWQAGRCQGAM